MRFPGVVLVLCSVLPPLPAAERSSAETPLAFEVEEQVVTVGFLPRPFIVDFVFTVASSTPATIRNFSTSCPCTSVGLDRKHYYPGQKGVITSLYEYRGQEEPEVQVIEVWTEGARRPQLLRIVPRRTTGSLWAERTALRWLAGNAGDAQNFDIELAPERGPATPSIEVSSPAWRAELHLTEVERRYRITVTPTTSEPPAAELRLRAGDDDAADPVIVQLVPAG